MRSSWITFAISPQESRATSRSRQFRRPLIWRPSVRPTMVSACDVATQTSNEILTRRRVHWTAQRTEAPPSLGRGASARKPARRTHRLQWRPGNANGHLLHNAGDNFCECCRRSVSLPQQRVCAWEVAEAWCRVVAAGRLDRLSRWSARRASQVWRGAVRMFNKSSGAMYLLGQG
jgi:hypothetical protein